MRWAGLLLATACGQEGYDRADWELEVLAPLPLSAETMRVCVQGAPVYELGAGNGRAAMTGLSPADTLVYVELVDEAGDFIAATEAVAMGDGAAVATAQLVEPWAEPCVDDGEYVASTEESRLLAVRFDEE